MTTHVISLINHKGGVGKTTSTLNLGKALSMLDKRVLIIDIDPQANLSQSLGIEEPEVNIYQAVCEGAELPIMQVAENFDIVPADLDLSEAELRLQSDVNGYFVLRSIVRKVAASYDYILIDCPPSLGILTLNALIASNKVIIVVQSEYLAVKGLQTIFNLIGKLRENLNTDLKILGMLITQLNHTVFRKSIADTVRSLYEGTVFQTTIRQNITLAEASAGGKDIFTYDSKSPGAEDYLNLAKEIIASEETTLAN
ncbi:MAG: ParA family protein [Microscillaceae bacterium]|nr:ParA family protein [Microscillaceae bacterium]